MSGLNHTMWGEDCRWSTSRMSCHLHKIKVFIYKRPSIDYSYQEYFWHIFFSHKNFNMRKVWFKMVLLLIKHNSDHQPYSCNLEPCNFVLFSKLKLSLKEIRLEIIQTVKYKATETINMLSETPLTNRKFIWSDVVGIVVCSNLKRIMLKLWRIFMALTCFLFNWSNIYIQVNIYLSDVIFSIKKRIKKV